MLLPPDVLQIDSISHDQTVIEDRWHQSIAATLKIGRRNYSDLARILTRLGYSTDEDGEVFFYPRKDSVQAWQTDELVSVSVFDGNRELDYYDHEEQEVDRVELSYLLPWRPVENARSYVTKVWELSAELGSPVLMNDVQIDAEDLLSHIDACASNLAERLEPPGGELLAQAIEEDLPL